MKTQPWAVALGCFVAGSLAAAGIANATSAPTKIPDSSTGVITACMKKKTGKVRFINAQVGKRCMKKEKKVTFNQTGPAGEQGVQGPIGPSKTYVSKTAPWLGTPITTADTAVSSLRVPAGSYLVQAQTNAWKILPATTRVACKLATATGTLTSENADWLNNGVAAGDSVPMHLTGTLVTTSDDTLVELSCRASGGDAGTLGGVVMTATAVGEVVVQ